MTSSLGDREGIQNNSKTGSSSGSNFVAAIFRVGEHVEIYLGCISNNVEYSWLTIYI